MTAGVADAGLWQCGEAVVSSKCYPDVE